MNGGSDTITLNQVIDAECMMIVNELEGVYNDEYTGIYPLWKSDNASDAAAQAAEDLCRKYERPREPNIEGRRTSAIQIYLEMIE